MIAPSIPRLRWATGVPLPEAILVTRDAAESADSEVIPYQTEKLEPVDGDREIPVTAVGRVPFDMEADIFSGR